MNPKILAAIAALLRESNPVAIREVPNGVCFEVQIGPATGGGKTLEGAIEQALLALAD